MKDQKTFIWFIDQLGLTAGEIAQLFNSDIDRTRHFTARDVKLMKKGKVTWPEGAWDMLRQVTTHCIADTQERIRTFNEAPKGEFIITREDMGTALGRLSVFMTCILLGEDIPVVMETSVPSSLH